MGIFSKGARARMDETKDYIRENVPLGERNAVEQYLDAEIQKMSGGGSIRGLSDPMSMNDLDERGTPDERKKRRALILMSYAKANGMDLNPIKALPAGQLGTNFFDSIKRLRLLADQTFGNGQLLQLQYNTMMAQPLQFLTANMLFTRGSNTDGQMVQNFFYEYKNGIGGFALCSNADPHPPRSLAVQVISVPGVVWSDVPGRGANSLAGSFATITGTELTGAILMVTTQFSGCCFCVKEVSATGNFYAAHIMPGLQTVPGSDIVGGGNRMAKQLTGRDAPAVAKGNFAPPGDGPGRINAWAGSHDSFYVYGSGFSNIGPVNDGYDSKRSMILIGVLGPAGWQFFSQSSVNRNITQARRIL